MIVNEQFEDNRTSYLTVDHFSEIRFEERKSVFYGWAAPVNSEQEALDYIDSAKKKYPDARHHVYAWVCSGKDIRSKYSDDGEPTGTAGLPVLDALRKNNIENAILIVIRYFGGILLGGGGLVRAYSNSAMLALKAAEIVTMQKYSIYELSCSYKDFEKIKHGIINDEYNLIVKEYKSDIDAIISCPVEKQDKLNKFISDISGGKVTLSYINDSYQKSSGPN